MFTFLSHCFETKKYHWSWLLFKEQYFARDYLNVKLLIWSHLRLLNICPSIDGNVNIILISITIIGVIKSAMKWHNHIIVILPFKIAQALICIDFKDINNLANINYVSKGTFFNRMHCFGIMVKKKDVNNR